MSDHSVVEIAAAARRAATELASAAPDAKNRCLRDLARRLRDDVDRILAANRRDLAAAEGAGLAGAKLQRLRLTADAVEQIAAGVEQIAAFDDPVGQVTVERRVPSGLLVRRLRCAIGVIMMIYEARPNVTVDAFALAFKAGNACILKGGREAAESNAALAACIDAALDAAGLPADCLALITSSDRDLLRALLRQDRNIDLVIPRGGESLIRFVHENSTIPTVQHFHGICHVYVDASADLDDALRICLTGKASAPATCNATEAILVHAQVAASFVPRLVDGFTELGVEVRGDEGVRSLAAAAVAATETDWGREFLDLIVAVRIVDGPDAAVHHIQEHGSGHTDAIIADDRQAQSDFVRRVQSSCTLVNASTRFNDGFQLGMGAEIGISTSRVHAYGPMGLEELTVQRFVVEGSGQSR